jgi:hypothetical protein
MNTDICANYHGGNACSVAACESSEGAHAAERDMIAAWVESLGATGATCDEAENNFESHFGVLKSLSPRWTELKASGRIAPNGEKRETKFKKLAEVFVSATHPSAKEVQLRARPADLRDYIARLVAELKYHNIPVPPPPPGL